MEFVCHPVLNQIVEKISGSKLLNLKPDILKLFRALDLNPGFQLVPEEWVLRSDKVLLPSMKYMPPAK